MSLLPRTFVVLLTAFLFIGCASIDSKQAAAFNQTVTTAGDTLKTSLSDTQAIEVQGKVDAAVDGTSLEHMDLDPDLSDKRVAAVMAQFNVLLEYSSSLSKLVGGGDFASSMAGLNGSIQQASGDLSDLTKTVSGAPLLTTSQATSMNKDLSTISGVVSVVGTEAITLYADNKAYQIAKGTDPAIQDYCSKLEALLCKDPDDKIPKSGLAGKIESDYEARVGTMKALYAKESLGTEKVDPNAKPTSPPDILGDYTKKSAFISQYAALRTSEKQKVDKVLALRKSITLIAKAHQALVKREDANFIYLITEAYATVKNAASNYKTGSSTTSPSTPKTPST